MWKSSDGSILIMCGKQDENFDGFGCQNFLEILRIFLVVFTPIGFHTSWSSLFGDSGTRCLFFGGVTDFFIFFLVYKSFSMQILVMSGEENDRKCKCGKPAKMQYDNGLACGYHCDDCFDDIVAEARSKSW